MGNIEQLLLTLLLLWQDTALDDNDNDDNESDDNDATRGGTSDVFDAGIGFGVVVSDIFMDLVRRRIYQWVLYRSLL